MNDSIASEDDISLLFEVLSSVKDKNDSPVVITANAVVQTLILKRLKSLISLLISLNVLMRG